MQLSTLLARNRYEDGAHDERNINEEKAKSVRVEKKREKAVLPRKLLPNHYVTCKEKWGGGRRRRRGGGGREYLSGSSSLLDRGSTEGLLVRNII